MFKVKALTLGLLIALSSAAVADVRNVCNGGSCRTIVTDSNNAVIWVSDLWKQY